MRALASGGPFPARLQPRSPGLRRGERLLHGAPGQPRICGRSPDHTGNTTFDGADRATEIYYLRSEDLGATLDALAAAQGDLGFLAGQVGTTSGVTASGHSFGGYTLHNLAGATFDAAVIDDCLDGSDTSSFCSTMDDAKAATLRPGSPPALRPS